MTKCEDSLSIQLLHGPGAGEVSFGGIDEADEPQVLEEENYDWADVFAGEWRVIESV